MVGLRAFISVGSLQYSWPSFIRTRSTRGVLQSRTKHHMTMDQEEEPWTQPRAQHRRRPGGSRMGNHQDNHDCWKEPLIQVDYIPPDSANTLFQPSMLLLVGLPGSGKSTFSRSLVQAMPYKVNLNVLHLITCLFLHPISNLDSTCLAYAMILLVCTSEPRRTSNKKELCRGSQKGHGQPVVSHCRPLQF